MKTKIIYISGNEIFDMRDIRDAFEEVRNALNLDKNTVLFGVPVDNEDAGFAAKTDDVPKANETPEIVVDTIEQIPTTEFIQDEPIQIMDSVEEINEPISESVMENIESIEEEQPIKKRGRKRKDVSDETENAPESDKEPENVVNNEKDEKIVPILSVLSTNDDEEESIIENVDVIPEITEETTTEIVETVELSDKEDTDLETLLSAMTPLDISEEEHVDVAPATPADTEDDISVDATLEQLASEFAEKQDKITSENKSSSRNRIGKLRNILPFKQSKHKDTGLGDLFGWAGIAANDEEFSVPGFFTNAASRK